MQHTESIMYCRYVYLELITDFLYSGDPTSAFIEYHEFPLDLPE